MATGNLIWTIINSLLIIVIPILGKIWINGKKAIIDKELTEIKSSLLKEQFMHQKQFEKEFDVYKELWIHLVSLKEATEILFPIGDVFEPGKEEKIKCLMKVQDSYRNVQKTINYNKPFYDESVYKNANKMLGKSIKQVLAFQSPAINVEKDNYRFIESLERGDRINEIIFEIENAIRNRIVPKSQSKK